MRSGSFNPYAAGIKHYGGGRNFPTIGMVDKTGYREREQKKAIIRRLKALQKGRFMDSSVLRNL